MSSAREEQQRITRLALKAAGAEVGFALAGSGALREHGLIDRPTEDVDLFTVQELAAVFAEAVDRVIRALQSAGYQVQMRRRFDTFVQLTVADSQGRSTGIDFGVDWRAHSPVHLEIGPVLAIEDAVSNKLGALFSRSEARDYLDVDAIRGTGLFSDDELLLVAERADLGFDREWFAKGLDAVERIRPEEVSIYGVTPEKLAAVKARMTDWAATIRGEL